MFATAKTGPGRSQQPGVPSTGDRELNICDELRIAAPAAFQGTPEQEPKSRSKVGTQIQALRHRMWVSQVVPNSCPNEIIFQARDC